MKGPLLGLLLWSATAGSAAGQEARDVRLGKGEVLVEMAKAPGADVPEARMEAVVDAPPAKVWAVLRDCKTYVGVLPRVKAAKELSFEGGVQVCAVTIDTPFPLPDLTAVTSAKVKAGPPRWTRTWTLLRGDYKRNDGSWSLTPFGAAGERTRVRYRVLVEPDVPVPGFVQSLAQERSLPDVIERIRAAVR